MTLRFEAGTCGLIGPNGAGKTTFFNVLCGLRAARPSGSVQAFDRDLLKMTHFRRARWGLRRTFQTEQAIAELSIHDNVVLVSEHAHSDEQTGHARRAGRAGLRRPRGRPARPRSGRWGRATAGSSRSHAPIVGQPRIVLLDEPAAGLPDEETAHLGGVIRRIPEHTGALVILVDHDMSLVSACCDVTAVLDFGKLIASGPTADVLRDERVVRAYLGTEEVAVA